MNYQTFLIISQFISEIDLSLAHQGRVSLDIAFNTVITIAYYSIPLISGYLVWQRQNFACPKLLFLFAAFIISVVTSQTIAIWASPYPTYWLSTFLEIIAAIVFLYVAIRLSILLPELLASAAKADLEKEIVKRKQTELALQQSEARYRAIVEDQTELICRFAPDTSLIFVNESFCRYFGKSKQELIGSSYRHLIFPGDLDLVQNQLEPLNIENPIVTVENRVIAKEQVRWMQWNNRMIFDRFGCFIEFQSVGRDITAQKEAEQQLQHKAFRDSLTGLYNRAAFIEQLQEAIELSQTDKEHSFAVIFLDLDGFKDTNDRLGHSIGDRLLISTARRLKKCVRSKDSVGRLGGDEFVIFLKEIGDIKEAIQIAERIRHIINLPFHVSGYKISISTSIGIASSRQNYYSAADMVRDADIAMYRAKNKGKNGYALFEPNSYPELKLRAPVF